MYTLGKERCLYLIQQFKQKSKQHADALSQVSVESSASLENKEPVYFSVSDVRRKLSETTTVTKKNFEV